MRIREVFYVIQRDILDELGVHAVIDMLRYDGAVPECNAPEGYYLFRVDSSTGPHVERWRSFGVHIPLEHISANRFDLVDVVRSKKATAAKSV